MYTVPDTQPIQSTGTEETLSEGFSGREPRAYSSHSIFMGFTENSTAQAWVAGTLVTPSSIPIHSSHQEAAGIRRGSRMKSGRGKGAG